MSPHNFHLLRVATRRLGGILPPHNLRQGHNDGKRGFQLDHRLPRSRQLRPKQRPREMLLERSSICESRRIQALTQALTQPHKAVITHVPHQVTEVHRRTLVPKIRHHRLHGLKPLDSERKHLSALGKRATTLVRMEMSKLFLARTIPLGLMLSHPSRITRECPIHCNNSGNSSRTVSPTIVNALHTHHMAARKQTRLMVFH